MTTNDPPATFPFTTANLGAAVRAAGGSFIGYSDSMPSVGYNGADYTSTPGQNQYERKHNPWVNWQSSSPTGNLLPIATNQPFTSFPGNFATLPSLAIVVPDQQHDMHDGTIKQADDWLQGNLGAYATWAKTNNSLLIVTWDEDAGSTNNRIPTVFSGANLKPAGTTAKGTYTLHDLQRTVASIFNATPSGSAINVKNITGVFASDGPQATLSFRQGSGGYASAHDTQLRQDLPSTSFGATTPLIVDQDDNGASGSQPVQALVRFDNIIGVGAGKVPAGATILSAKLDLHTGSQGGDETTAGVNVHRMLSGWSESSTWDTLVGGVSPDGVEAASAPEFTLTPNVTNISAFFDVTDTVQAWVNGAANNGWVLLAGSTNGWRFGSSELGTIADRPGLTITYAVPEPGSIGMLVVVMLVGVARRRRKRIAC